MTLGPSSFLGIFARTAKLWAIGEELRFGDAAAMNTRQLLPRSQPTNRLTRRRGRRGLRDPPPLPGRDLRAPLGETACLAVQWVQKGLQIHHAQQHQRRLRGRTDSQL